MEVCYIDVNGPSNMGGFNDPQFLKRYPPFDPKQSFLAPAVITYVQKLSDELKLSDEGLKDLFIEVANINYISLKLPVDPMSAWKRLHTDIKLVVE